MKSISLSLLALAWTINTAQAELRLDLEGGGVWAGYGDVRIPNEGGSLFSLTDDLNADQPSEYWRARITWSAGKRHHFAVLAAPLRMDFSGRFNQETDFAGETFAPGVNTSARFRFDSYRLTYRYQFISSENFDLGLGLTAKVRDAEIRLTQGNRTAMDDNIGVVPLINWEMTWRFARPFSLYSEGDALGAPQGRAIDALLALQWDVSPNVALRLGYRILEGGADNDTVYNFSLFHYAMAGVSVRF